MMSEFDDMLRTAVIKMHNIRLLDDQRTQTRLLILYGGLGMRSVSKPTSSTLLSSGDLASDHSRVLTLIFRGTQVNEMDTGQSGKRSRTKHLEWHMLKIATLKHGTPQ